MDVTKMLGVNKLLNRFTKDINDKYRYSFKINNVSDYELILTYEANSKILNSIFNQVSKALIRKDSKFTRLHSSDPSMIEKFKVPQQFNNRIHTTVIKNIKAVDKQELNPDGYYIMKSQVNKCYFINKGQKTIIEVYIGGVYVKK